MRRALALFFVVVLLSANFAATPTYAQAPAVQGIGTCTEDVLPSGALSLICIPDSWNGNLVMFAHGYTAFNEPLDFQNLSLPDGTYLPDLVQGLGFAFATTSYRRNGLAILEGVEDIRELVEKFGSLHGTPSKTYLVGASEGGIVTTLFTERYPSLISGGLATCGPIGNFRDQLNYWGDFRVLFDYFYPNLIPGHPASIPAGVITNWESVYVPAISAALAANPSAADQLIATSKAAVDANDASTIENTVQGLLWYNVFATNDGNQQLGGNPFGNRARRYSGSLDDAALNAGVRRLSPRLAALQAMKPYETSGNPSIPLVVMHTTGDEIIPFNQAVKYAFKLTPTGRSNVNFVPINAYGHCNFTTNQVLASFALLVFKSTGVAPVNMPAPAKAVDLRMWSNK